MRRIEEAAMLKFRWKLLRWRKLVRQVILFLIITIGLTRFSYSQNEEKVAVLWCDPLLNIRQISTRIGIVDIVDKAQIAGIQAIALGVKTLSGEVLYESKVAPRLLDWEDFRVPLNFNPINVFLEEGKKRGLKIYAVFTVFSEGHMIQKRGPIYSNHPEWQTQVYAVEEGYPKILPITDWAHGTAAFVNPLLKEVQDYEIEVVIEFLKTYRVDGIIFDRVRFNGIDSDFSDFTKHSFETYLNLDQRLQWWPKDVYELQYQNEQWEVVPGKYFQEWINFRTKSIYNFIKKLIRKVREVNRDLPIGNFVGSWYPTYYEYGVNWASKNSTFDYEWTSPEYYESGIAELLDYLITACYFPRITMNEAEEIGAEWWMSIEGGASLSMETVKNVCPVYAAVWAFQFKDDSEKFEQALKTARKLTDGLYIYDLSHIEKYKYWDEIASVLKKQKDKAHPP